MSWEAAPTLVTCSCSWQSPRAGPSSLSTATMALISHVLLRSPEFSATFPGDFALGNKIAAITQSSRECTEEAGDLQPCLDLGEQVYQEFLCPLCVRACPAQISPRWTCQAAHRFGPARQGQWMLGPSSSSAFVLPEKGPARMPTGPVTNLRQGDAKPVALEGVATVSPSPQRLIWFRLSH